MKIGYVRVSKQEQHEALQIDAFKEAGCEKWFLDKMTGSKAERKGLDEALAYSHGLRNELTSTKEERKARHVGKARWACFFTSPNSLDPDPDSVTHIPGDGFGPKRLERSEASAIKTELLFGELELVAQRIAPHHLKKPCSVSLLDMMKHHLTGEAEVAALAQGVERFVLWPDLEALSQPALPDKLH